MELSGPPRRVGKTGDHLQLMIRQNNSTMKCIAFKAGELFDRLKTGTRLNLAVEPSLNEFNGFVSVELEVKDIQFGRIANQMCRSLFNPFRAATL